MLKETVFVFAALVVFADATVVNHCNTHKNILFEDTMKINISGCDKPTCLLKQETNVTIEIKFMSNKDIQNLTNELKGTYYSKTTPFCFVGVDGTNACDNIYNVDGSKNGCPLEMGVDYVYKNSFLVSKYPRGLVNMRYGWREGKDRVLCFEVPSKIE